MMNNGLHIGDKTRDDSLVAIDEDRLYYSVKSTSNALMEAWLREPICSFVLHQ